MDKYCLLDTQSNSVSVCVCVRPKMEVISLLFLFCRIYDTWGNVAMAMSKHTQYTS